MIYSHRFNLLNPPSYARYTSCIESLLTQVKYRASQVSQANRNISSLMESESSDMGLSYQQWNLKFPPSHAVSHTAQFSSCDKCVHGKTALQRK